MTRSGAPGEILRRLAPFTTAALVAALAYLGWEFLSRRSGDTHVVTAPGEMQAAYRGLESYTGTELKILQFYGAPASILEHIPIQE